MAKAITVNDAGVVANTEPTAKEAAWEKFKVNFQEKHPVQYAEYDEEHYWDNIPENFTF